MRLTIDQTDPDFDDAKNWNAEVYLDGVLVNGCTEADDIKGYIVRYKEQREPHLDYWPTEKIYGKVEIKLNARN